MYELSRLASLAPRQMPRPNFPPGAVHTTAERESAACAEVFETALFHLTRMMHMNAAEYNANEYEFDRRHHARTGPDFSRAQLTRVTTGSVHTSRARGSTPTFRAAGAVDFCGWCC